MAFGQYQILHDGNGAGGPFPWAYKAPQVGRITGVVRWAPSAAHPGSMSAALLDGSVRAINSSITVATFWRACRADDGLTLDGNW